MTQTRWPWLVGWLSLAVPTLWDYLFGAWESYSQGHELLLLAVVGWLFGRGVTTRPVGVAATLPRWAVVAFLLGLCAYLFGRTQEFIRIELLSLWWVSQMVVCLIWGADAWRRSWFVWFFALFALPLPFSWVLMLTAPLKEAVSWVATQTLGALGYPVARTGVVVTVGQYQLLVAEACAGLHSMFVLEAMGLLYGHLAQHVSRWRTAALALLAVPVSFAANVIRVMVLMLVTYHFGDEVGQGFVHHFAGAMLFAIALALMALLDAALGWVWPDRASRPSDAGALL
ncbi:exosortase [Aquabacterium sp.]|uniref:exosortase n=1 Tax=Aquabacterium sp. TaxID=1872578 RepID=UPI002E30DEF4|nr:exosortase [Aquabacterium sp.]HEX5312787.1 exosortase [Aquabacterium sp.]